MHKYSNTNKMCKDIWNEISVRYNFSVWFFSPLRQRHQDLNIKEPSKTTILIRKNPYDKIMNKGRKNIIKLCAFSHVLTNNNNLKDLMSPIERNIKFSDPIYEYIFYESK